jgi:mannobiose 2-epimerase
MRRAFVLLTVLLAGAGAARAQPHATADAPLTPEVRVALAAEVEGALRRSVLDAWYPRAVDREAGGFLSRFDADWRPVGDQQKMTVTQARHTWTTARAAEATGDTTYLALARHGAAFLRRMWDPRHGGFFWLVERDGTPVATAPAQPAKQAYGVAFGIYALAAVHDVTGDPAALALAQDAFRWLDAHAYDPVHGGYVNLLAADGTPYRDGLGRIPPKDQNSSIHILEAFTELYHVWPDPHLRDRIAEMLALVRDRLTVAPGTLTQFSRADWTPVSYRDSSDAARTAHRYFDHISFGHDVETAYLMLEAAHALGVDPAPTLAAGRRMVDHSLRTGWDTANGGFVEAGYILAGDTTVTILDATKNWWAQAEGLNTLLLLGDLVPEAAPRYHGRFLQQWAYIQAYLIDHARGGWYAGGIDRQPALRDADKAFIWKGPYHDGRALMNVARRLRGGPTG